MISSDSLKTRCSQIVYWLLMQIDFMRIVEELNQRWIKPIKTGSKPTNPSPNKKLCWRPNAQARLPLSSPTQERAWKPTFTSELHELEISKKFRWIFHGVSFTRIIPQTVVKILKMIRLQICEVYEKQGGKNTNLLEFSFFSSYFCVPSKRSWRAKNLVHGWEQKKNRLGKLRRNIWKHLSCVSWTVLISTIFCHEPPS